MCTYQTVKTTTTTTTYHRQCMYVPVDVYVNHACVYFQVYSVTVLLMCMCMYTDYTKIHHQHHLKEQEIYTVYDREEEIM